MIETLENRVLLTSVLDPANGALTVNGLAGAANDNILVDQVVNGGTAFVRVQHFNHIVNGKAETQLFPAGRVNAIFINGFAGNDQLRVAPTLNKSATIIGGDGNDIVVGGAAADRLVGGNGNDTLIGNGGDDVLFSDPGADQIFGGAGTDTVTYAGRLAGVVVSLDNLPGDGQAGENDNVHSDVENVIGTQFDDVLIGSAANNVLSGGAGNDRLIGRGGADTLNGEDGDDILDARDGAGTDKGDGGAGVDTLFVDSLIERLQFVNVP